MRHFQGMSQTSIVFGELRPAWLESVVAYSVPKRWRDRVEFLWPLEMLDLSDTTAGDAELRLLAQFGSQLNVLDLSGTSVTNSGLVWLQECSRLEDLSLANTSIDDSGLMHLHPLRRLNHLVLERTPTSGLQGLAALRELSFVNLSGTNVTAEGTQVLADLPELDYLILRGEKIGDAEAGKLGLCPRLRNLRVSETAVGDRGLQELTRCQSLEMLHVAQSRVTAAGLAGLASDVNIRLLQLDTTQVSKDVVARLSRMPSLKKVNCLEIGSHAEVRAANRALSKLSADRDVVVVSYGGTRNTSSDSEPSWPELEKAK